MAVLGVILGVASIVSVHLISTTVAAQLDSLIPTPLQGMEAALTRSEPVSASDYYALRKDWRAGRLPSVKALWPVIDESLLIDGHRVRLLGIDFINRIGVRPARTTLSEHIGADQTASDMKERAPADLDAGVWVSGTLSAALRQDERFAGLKIYGELALDDVVLLDIGAAQAVLGWAVNDRISYVGLALDNALHQTYGWLDRIAPGASAGLPEQAPVAVAGWLSKSMGELQPANRFGRAVLFNIGALGFLALIVAWFLIYQVAAAWLRRLWQVFSRLHVLGVTYAELRVYFLGLLTALGSLSGGVGLCLGYLLADQLLRLSTGDQYALSIDAWLLAKAFGSALLVCWVGGYWAYEKILTEAPVHRRLRAAVMLAALTGMVVSVGSESSGLLGAFLAIACACLLLLAMLLPTLGALRRNSGNLVGRLLVRMSLREVVWFPGDLWVALGGLVLAVATAIGVGLMVDSFRTEFSRMLDQRLSYAFSIEGDPKALMWLDARAGTVSGIRSQLYFETVTRIQAAPFGLSYSKLDSFEAARYGYDLKIAANEILVSEQAARVLNVRQGSRVSLAGESLLVAHVFKSFGDALPRLILPLASKPDGLLPSSVSLLGDGAPASTWLALEQRKTQLRWQNQTTIREMALQTFDRTFAITTILIFIAVMVAGIGIYVATTVLRLNQQASTRILMGMGISRLEVFGIDFARGTGIGLLACLLALPLGCTIGWILCNVVNPRAFGWTVALDFQFDSLAVPIGFGMLAAVAAALIRVGQQEQGRMDVLAR